MARPRQQYFELFGKVDSMCFIETGTYRGGGVRAALAAGFAKVHSIEAVKTYYDDCVRQFGPLIEESKVALHYGPSETVLPALVKSMPGPIFYWLDAHFHGEESERSAMKCPLAVEVDAICAKGTNDHDVIFIDDVRMLVRKRSWRGHKVVFEKVMGKLLRNFPNHFSCFLDGHVKNDVFCLVPRRYAADFFAIRASAPFSFVAWYRRWVGKPR